MRCLIMISVDELTDAERESSGILHINIYPVVEYPNKIKVSKIPYYKNYSSGKWRKRIGDFIFYYGESVKSDFEKINVNNPLFGRIFRKYILDLLSESISAPWRLKELKSTLRIVKEISQDYGYSDIIKLQYELTIGVHHWQDTNFGLIVDLKINVLDRESQEYLSYLSIKEKYGEDVRRSIWRSVQAFHKHLILDGKKYATAMRDKFNLITDLLKESFGLSGHERIFDTSDEKIKIAFKPLEIVKVSNDDGI